MGWIDGLGCALVDEDGDSLPDGLPFGDELTLCMVVLVMSVAMRLGSGHASQNGGGGGGDIR